MKNPFITFAISAVIAGQALAAEPIWDGNKVNMVSEKLGDGAFAYYADNARELNAKGGAAATSGGLIVGSKGALLVESMLNQRLNAQVQKLSKQLSHQPILYVVNTSWHGDHAYGNMYLPKTTKVIQHENAYRYIRQHLKDDKAFMIKNFGEGRGIEEIRARTGDILVPAGGKLSIDLGGKMVEVIDFGFAQTGGDLMVWDPQDKVLWAGNPIIAGKPALPWLLNGHLVATLETLRRVYEFLPPDARVIPGHGVAIGREDLKWHIDYLATVRSEVQSAIDEGLTLEQTVKRVAMPEFAGYSLFNWVHPDLNVPAAYADLSKH